MQMTVRRTLALSAICAALCAAGTPARAGVMDFLFGSKKPGAEAASNKQRSWQISEFTAVRLTEKEAGAANNEHPATLNADALRMQLASVQVTARGETQALFGADELQELNPVLAEALSVAGPGDDVLLLSTSRRGGGLLSTPYGMTARLFVQGGALQFIVHDARLDFVNAYRGTHVVPTFVFGSRTQTGLDTLRSTSAATRRADWLSFPLGGVAAAPAPVAVPALAPAATTRPAAAAAATPAAPAAAPAAPSARDAAFYDAQEQRLRGLKRLRDQGLLTEEEYQQKRREIMQSL